MTKKQQDTHNNHSQETSQSDVQQAIALFYDGKQAPKVSAKGEADLAEEIIAIAREHGVPLYENPELVRSLAQLDLGDEIPELLYRVIAEIIAFAYHIQGKTPEGFQPPPNSDSDAP
ncbi:EscU/YscU/HrcU family type III secretion system export apparatus switch protein [Hahella aquimaris]|uniref:EscU/YscU/HrcU family type III secretion system export apparatus switch protein n=1 Tax=Hahella sp. HNIBRBA332 TaxID=3015983 RepID=UPI00273BF791|nr:EscU/YscU/HrcU family type III secretion system export apparatus switch protein [Hahella sp. HNIBRBA332]WLQ17224.1 EscU/YscU/HrcU family type III secretion system export apparatus switch protein [Hahella sp. HNIBRBA332]